MKKSPVAVSLAEQKTFAEEVDRRVAQRTAELTAANEQLKKELAERKRAEAVLREDDLFNLIVNSIPAPVAVTSPSGEVEALNKPTLEYFGRTFQELKDWKSSDVVHPDDLERTIAAQIEAHQTGNAYNVESRHRRADGVYRWFNVLGLPLRDTRGRILHWFHLLIDIDDRKRAEEASRFAERNLSLTIDTIPTFIQVSRSDGTVLSVNQTVLDYYGVTLQEMQTEDFRSRFYHPDDLKRLREQRQEALKRPLQFEYEQRARGKDGKYRWFLVRYNPLLNDQGKIDRWYATAFDIEDRKRAEDALVRQAGVRADVSEAFSKPTHLAEILRGCTEAIVRHLDAAFARIWLLNKDESILELEASAGMYTRLDGSYSRIPVGDLKVGWIARKKKAHLTNDVMHDPRVHNKEWAKDNGIVAFAGYPLMVEDQLIGVVALFARHPVSESILDTLGSVADMIAQGIQRKRAEEALRNALDEIQKSESKLRQVIDAIPALAWCNLPDGPNEFLNKGWHEYTGLSAEESHGWGWQAAFHPEDLPPLMERWLKMLTSGEPDQIEARLRRHDDVYRWFLIRAEPFRDESGKIVRWYGTSTDIDDRKRAETQLAGEKRLLEMVASGHSLTDVLSELCKFVETTTADCKCGIYFVDWRSGTFQFGLAPSLPATFNDRIKGLTVTADAGPCGVAALTKSQVIVSDVESDPRFQSATIRPLLSAHGLRSHWSTPIYSRNGQVLATFAIFQSSPSNPTLLQLDLISQVTHIASIAIERALSEEALKSSEQQFKTIFDEAGAGIALVDLTSDAPIRNNRALQKMLGCSEEELGRFETFDRLTHENDREKDAATFRELKDGKRDSLRLEKHFVLEDGRSIWANVIFNLLRDDEGRPHYIIAIHEDITDRKQTLETMQAKQDLLDLAQKSAGAMAFDWYIQQEINNWSPEQEALFGLAPGTFDGAYKTWKSMMYKPDWPIVVDAIKHAHETGKVTAEYRVVWPDGSLHWLSTNGRMFFDDAGEPLRMVGFTSDVTRRKNVEEELRRSAAFLAQAQQVSRTGSFSWRVATDEITWSEQLYRIYELEPGTNMTLDVIRTRVHPEDLTLYEKMVEQARNGSDDFEWQYRLLMPDQSIKYMHAVARATRDQNGQLEYIAAVRDVTARRLSDEALDKARSELAHVARVMSLGALTASIAHEVNQPLSGIITNASTCVKMLDADPPNVDGARETAKRTIRDGRRAADVIARLRALFSKKEAATELVDLNEATREVIALSLSELERNNVITRTELADELPLVTGDRVQLQQVIINLLRNGSDAMSSVDDRPRELLFKTELNENDWVRLSVRDAGTGLDQQTLDQLFRSFYTTKADGMGIGLSVSRSIIENHRGRIWATPNNGPGVTFSFALPIVVES